MKKTFTYRSSHPPRKRRKGLPFLLFLLIGLGSANVSFGQTIIINEVLADPANDLLGDANGDGVRESSGDEFIEIVNNNGSAVDISGWTLSDDDAPGGAFTFPAGTILADQCAAVLFGGGTPSGFFGGALVFTDDGTIGSGLANGGDLIELRDDGGNLIASYMYGSEGGNNESLTRDPDITGAEPFVQHASATGSGGALFSPGTLIDGSSFAGCDAGTFDLQITEIWPGQEGTDLTEDWFEITNKGNAAWISGVDPNLFYDDESQDTSSAEPIIGITSIGPGESAIVVIGVEADGTTFFDVWSPDIDLTGIQIGSTDGAGLGQSGDAVNLFFGNTGVVGLLDTEAYPDAPSGISWDVDLAAFSTVGNANGAVQTTATAGSNENEPAIGSPGNQGPTAPKIVINEILADPANNIEGDANRDGTRDASQDEFIEIVNNNGSEVDLSGWTLSDDDAPSGRFTFPEGTFLSDQCAAVLFGGGTPTGSFGNALVFTDDGTIGTGLANSGDQVELRDENGELVASYAYGSEGDNNQSLTRDPDITGDEPLVLHTTASGSGETSFSPGTLVNGTSFVGCMMAPPLSPVINEFVFNHDGADVFEYIEVFGDPDFDYSGLTLVVIEGDGTVGGVIDDVLMPGMTGPNGIWVSTFLDNELENGTQTLLLVSEFSGAMGDDLDTDNDGNLDVEPWTEVLDGVAVKDDATSDNTYTGVVLEQNFDGIEFTVGGASRIPNGQDTDTTNDWVRNDFDLAGIPGFAGSIMGSEAINTPGETNKTLSPILITEIMYNPASDEADWEWVEILNTTGESIDLAGYVLDDDDGSLLETSNIAGGIIQPGQSAILFNADDITAAAFELAWGCGILRIPVTEWSGLSNGGDRVSIWSSIEDYDGRNSANAIISFMYDDSGDWPSDNGASSIYLTELALDPAEGTSWAISNLDDLTPVGGLVVQSQALGGNSGNDLGSPGGFQDVTPASIFEIQTVMPGEDKSPLEGTVVKTEGIVTALLPATDGSENRFLVIQDEAGGPFSGIFLFSLDLNGFNPGSYPIGTKLQVIGEVIEFSRNDEDNALTEILITDALTQIIVLETPAPEVGDPAALTLPVLLTTGAFPADDATLSEQWEGVLIQFDCATITNEDLGFDEFSFNDGTGDARADLLGDFDFQPENDLLLKTIEGIGFFGFNTYKILPRGDEDIDADGVRVFPQAKLFEDITAAELSGAEIIAYDADSKTIFATSGSGIERININDPANPTTLPTIDPSTQGFNNNEVTHVQVMNGIVAAALPDADEQAPGDVLFYDTNGNFLGSVEVGALPDMLTFTPDGTKVLTANEGQPNEAYDNDPEGSVSLIDISGGVASATVQTAGFSSFDVDALRAAGLKIPSISGIEALEPEYVAVSPDGTKAFVTLQEVNAVAVIDIASATVTEIFALGFKDHSLPENAMDASNRDDGINIRTWPTLGMYQPDAIAIYEVAGQLYFVTANEGDAIDYDGFSEEVRVADLVLDPTAYPDAATLQLDENLGRLKTTTVIGDTDGDGDFDQIYSYGSRSFSIWNADNGALVFDSGNDFELITKAQVPTFFNGQGTEDSFDSRSDDKGPEPEAITIAEVDGRTCAFIGLERIGGYMVYDISDPNSPEFLNYVPGGSDRAPEDIEFIKAEDSPTGEPIVAIANEVTGTVALDNSLIKGACPNTIKVCGNPSGGTNEFVAFAWEVIGGTSTGFNLVEGIDDPTLTIDIEDALPGTIELQFTATDDSECSATGTTTVVVEGSAEALFDVTAQFDDFTQVILGSAFASNDVFELPAGDCHSDLSFAVRFDEESFCFRGVPAMAATNLTTGAFLQVTGPDAFDDFVFETDDLTAGTYDILVEANFASAQFQIEIKDVTPPTIDVPGGTLALQAPSVCEGDRLQVWSFQGKDDCLVDGSLDNVIDIVSVNELNFFNGPAPFFFESDFNNEQFGILLLDLSAGPFEVNPALANLFYEITVSATDASGNNTTKTFFIQVDPPAVGGINSLACNDAVNVTLNANCTAPLFPDAVLEGLPSACEGEYYVKVAYPYDGYSINSIRKCGTFKYTVYLGDPENPDTENDTFICWGEVNAEDKTPPTGCIDKVIGLRKTPGTATPVVQHGQTIDTDIDADYFGAAAGKKVFKKIGGTFYFYEPLTANNYCEGDHINEEFDPSSESDNLLICTDVDSILNISASYTDKNYAYFVGTPALFDDCATEGWEPKVKKVVDKLVDFECDYPVDVTEVEVDGGRRRLESQRIERTFFFEDEKGNEGSVTQYICFFKPVIKLPNCKETFDVCWYGADNELNPVEIGSFPSYTNAACMTMPLLDHVCNVTITYEDLRLPGPAKCGDKVIRTWTILDWCWDPIRYRDLDLTDVAEGCPAPEFEDWKQKRLTWEQHLILGGSDDFTVECPIEDKDWYNGSDAPTFSVGAFNCEASFIVPEPIIKKDGRANNACNYTYTVEIYSEVEELWHGVPTGEKTVELFTDAHIVEDIDEATWTTNSVTVSKLPKGAYFFKYIARDACGGEAVSEHCRFYVIDEVAPIAVCNDDLNVSIGGDNYARVYAKDLDEGSYDNCSEIELTARRFIPQECLDAFVANTEWTYQDVYLATRRSRTNSRPIRLNKDESSLHRQLGYYSPWFDYVDFTCCDIKGQVLIELRVRDNANMSLDDKGEPIFGDAYRPFETFVPTQKDNENICWLELYVEDKIAPVCEAPKDVEIDCADVIYNLPEVSKHTSAGKNGIVWGPEEIADPANEAIVEWLMSFDDPAGRPSASDNCEAKVEMVKVKFVIHCKAGYIERTFEATDDWGLKSTNTCKQVIWISRHHDYCIKFPKDAVAECKETPDVPSVEFFDYGCDLLAVSIQDERFNTDIGQGDDSECYKIFRTYRVINWCQFDEDIDPDLPLFDRFDTEYDLDPLVVGRDEDCDGWPGDEDVYVRFKGKVKNGAYAVGKDNEFGTWIDADCEPWNDFPRANTGCSNPLGHWEYYPFYYGGFFQYTQVIKVYDDIAPILIPVGDERFAVLASPGKDDDKAAVCVGKVDRMFEVDENCTPDLVDVDRVILKPDPVLGLGPVTLFERGALTSMGANFGFAISIDRPIFTLSGTFPLGDHEFEVRVSDGCGLTAGIDLPFEVFDGKAPAPICNSRIGVELMPVDADNDGKRDEDAGMAVVWAKDFIVSEIWDCSEPINYTIERAADIDAGAEPDPSRTNLEFSCDDSEVVFVYIYAWDSAGNHDRCEAIVLINDLNELCSPTSTNIGTTAGYIYTEEDFAVPGVEVQITGQTNDAMVTSNAGGYRFDLEAELDYTITPVHDLDHRNGVSTYDLVVISQHILGIQALSSPYKMIAADVNNSKSITTLDLINIRKLILNIDKEFGNNTSWRFVDAAYTFQNETNPWQEAFPEVINVNNLEVEAIINGDFVAIKVGDVTADAQVGDLLQPREIAGVFTIDVMDQAVKAGNTYEVDFTTADLGGVLGYQFTLNYNESVDIVDIQAGVAQAQNFGLFVESDAITTSWNQPNWSAGGTSSDEVLFTVVLKANVDAQLNEVFTIGSLFTQAEAYNNNGELLDVAIDFGGDALAASSLFELGQNTPNPFDGMTMIKYIVPEAGQATLTITDMTGKVLNVITQDATKGVNTVEVNNRNLPSGVLYYTLESAEFIATRKMVSLKQ